MKFDYGNHKLTVSSVRHHWPIHKGLTLAASLMLDDSFNVPLRVGNAPFFNPQGNPLNKESVKAILDNECQLPAGADLDDLTSHLTINLGSTDAYVRENSMEILWTWGPAGRYSDDQLMGLGRHMAANLSVGLGESGTDTVFLRAFSALILAMVVIVD